MHFAMSGLVSPSLILWNKLKPRKLALDSIVSQPSSKFNFTLLVSSFVFNLFQSIFLWSTK